MLIGLALHSANGRPLWHTENTLRLQTTSTTVVTATSSIIDQRAPAVSTVSTVEGTMVASALSSIELPLLYEAPIDSRILAGRSLVFSRMPSGRHRQAGPRERSVLDIEEDKASAHISQETSNVIGIVASITIPITIAVIAGMLRVFEVDTSFQRWLARRKRKHLSQSTINDGPSRGRCDPQYRCKRLLCLSNRA